jgi:hypothetical protein
MTMIAYAFLQHRRLASDVILEALASSGACDAALQMADATIIQTLCWPRKGSRASVLGRSRGGDSTKINARTNAEGLPIGLVITPGQAHDVTAFPALMQEVDCDPEQLLADKGYDSEAVRQEIEDHGGGGCRSAKSANKNEINVAILRRSSSF